MKRYSDLWQEIFKDGKTFIDNYFAVFLNSKTFHYIEKDSSLISALIACDYEWFWHEKTLSFAYLSGILTDTKFRHQGYCTELINNTLNSLNNQSYCLGGLIAADDNLAEYYKKFGFIKCNEINDEIFHRRQVNNLLFDKYIFVKDADITLNCYNKFFNRKDNAVKHSHKTLSLYNNSEYQRFAVTYQGTVRAFAVGRKTKGFIDLFYLDFDDSESKTAILSFIAKTSRRDIRIISSKNTMIRIVDVRKILELYAPYLEEEKISLHIADPIIEKNNITVEISEGKLKNIDNSFKIKRISIEDLTAKLFINGRFFLMLDM